MEYEYIVVGSGAGGGPLAANLAAAGHTVLLLEAGGSPETDLYDVPAFHPTCSEDESMSWEFYVRHYADRERQKRDPKFCPENDGVFYPRAGTLGGCTAHNAMIVVYPQKGDWDLIARITGDRSWSDRAMRRYYQHLEDCRYRRIWRFVYKILPFLNPTRHGFRGWLPTEEADPGLLLEDRQLRRMVEWSTLKNLFGSGGWLRGISRILSFLITAGDPNTWWTVRAATEGLRLVPLSTLEGRRRGSRERVLAAKKAHPDKLTVQLGALATKVLFDDGNRAIGVEYLEGDSLYRADPRHRPEEAGTRREARASREVILCGGAFNTPQLLQLSGIGPADLLHRHGIPVRVDLPGVGLNLQDRYEAGVVLKMRKPFKMLLDATMLPPEPGEPGDPAYQEWRKSRGIYTTNGAVMSIVKRSEKSQPVPDLFLFGLVTDFRGYYRGYSKRIREAKDCFTWAILKAHTENTAGRVAIRSADPRDMPDVNFHYFTEGNDADGSDLDSVVHAVEFIRAIVKGYGHMVEEELLPGPQIQTPDQIRQFIQDEAWGHHASCTCKIGADDDPTAVLDGDFRVRGTRGLRVVDASVFPRIPGLFIVSAVFMIAEKASEVILADARRDRSHSQGGAIP